MDNSNTTDNNNSSVESTADAASTQQDLAAMGIEQVPMDSSAPSDTSSDSANLLAGKYKDQAGLEQGYLELQKKFTEMQQQASPTGDGTQSNTSSAENGNPLTLNKQADEGDKGKKAVSKQTASELLDTFEQSFADTGELTAEQVKALEKKGMSQGDAELLLNTRKANAEKYLTDLLEPVGGLEEWNKISEFLQENMTEEAQQEFNEAMTTGSTLVKSLLIQHAKDTVDAENGVAPTGQTKGDSTKVVPSSDKFNSQREMSQAVGDPKYHTDLAYREEVNAKIQRSDQSIMNGM